MTLHVATRTRPSASRRRCAKAGLSLLEVMIATGIMAASSMALLRLGRIGNEHALRSESLSEVVMLAQNKIHALEAGIEPLVAVERRPFAEHTDWEYTLQVEPATAPDLWRVTIEVFACSPAPGVSEEPGNVAATLAIAVDVDQGLSDRRSPTGDAKPSRWSLTQWIRRAATADTEGTPSAIAPIQQRSPLDRGGRP